MDADLSLNRFISDAAKHWRLIAKDNLKSLYTLNYLNLFFFPGKK